MCSLGPCVSFKWLSSCGPFTWAWILSTCMIHNNVLLSISCSCLSIICTVIGPFICLMIVVYFLGLLCNNVLLARSVVVTSTTSNRFLLRRQGVFCHLYGIASCVCSFSILLARLTLTLIPLLVAGSVFGNGLQTVSVLGHARKLSFRSCCVSLVHADH